MRSEPWTKERIGAWLSAVRQADEQRASLDALGERVGRSRQQLADYFKGRRDPRASVLLNVLEELGVEIPTMPTKRTVDPAVEDVLERATRAFIRENRRAVRQVIREEIDAQQLERSHPEVAPADRPPRRTRAGGRDALP